MPRLSKDEVIKRKELKDFVTDKDNRLKDSECAAIASKTGYSVSHIKNIQYGTANGSPLLLKTIKAQIEKSKKQTV